MLRNAAIGNMHNVPTSTTKGLPTPEDPLCNPNFIIFSTCTIAKHHDSSDARPQSVQESYRATFADTDRGTDNARL